MPVKIHSKQKKTLPTIGKYLSDVSRIQNGLKQNALPPFLVTFALVCAIVYVCSFQSVGRAPLGAEFSAEVI
jgi:hypothetical protein